MTDDRPGQAWGGRGTYAGLAAIVLGRPATLGEVRLVAVDGRAGSGKTTFADRLARALRQAGPPKKAGPPHEAETPWEAGTLQVRGALQEAGTFPAAETLPMAETFREVGALQEAGAFRQAGVARDAGLPREAGMLQQVEALRDAGALEEGGMLRDGGVEVAVLHTDDFLDGWGELLAWRPRLAEWVFEPFKAGRDAAYRRYDWETERLRDEWEPLRRPDVLIVEGVGSASAGDVTLAVAVRAPRALRLERGLRRDGDALRPQWEQWMADEDRHYARAASGTGSDDGDRHDARTASGAGSDDGDRHHARAASGGVPVDEDRHHAQEAPSTEDEPGPSGVDLWVDGAPGVPHDPEVEYIGSGPRADEGGRGLRR